MIPLKTNSAGQFILYLLGPNDPEQTEFNEVMQLESSKLSEDLSESVEMDPKQESGCQKTSKEACAYENDAKTYDFKTLIRRVQANIEKHWCSYCKNIAKT